MKKILRAASFGFILLFAFAQPVFAEFSFNKEGIPFTNLGDLLRNALLIIFFFAAVLAFVFILIGGIQWITAGGDKFAAASARDRITAAVIGLVIVMATFGLTLIVTSALGINIFGGGVINLPTTLGPFDTPIIAP